MVVAGSWRYMGNEILVQKQTFELCEMSKFWHSLKINKILCILKCSKSRIYMFSLPKKVTEAMRINWIVAIISQGMCIPNIMISTLAIPGLVCPLYCTKTGKKNKFSKLKYTEFLKKSEKRKKIMVSQTMMEGRERGVKLNGTGFSFLCNKKVLKLTQMIHLSMNILTIIDGNTSFFATRDWTQDLCTELSPQSYF